MGMGVHTTDADLGVSRMSGGRWRMIRIGSGGIDTNCIFDGNGPPNSNHPQCGDAELAERICRLLNEEEAKP